MLVGHARPPDVGHEADIVVGEAQVCQHELHPLDGAARVDAVLEALPGGEPVNAGAVRPAREAAARILGVHEQAEVAAVRLVVEEDAFVRAAAAAGAVPTGYEPDALRARGDVVRDDDAARGAEIKGRFQ